MSACRYQFIPLVKGAHFRVANDHVLLVQTQIASLSDVGISLTLLDYVPFDGVGHFQVHEFPYVLCKRSTALVSFLGIK